MARPSLSNVLDSIAAQSYGNIEIVVVAANGSHHPAMPSSWCSRPIRFVQTATSLTRPAAANHAIAAATGELLNFLDDDDRWESHHVTTLVAALQAQTHALAYSVCRVIDDHGRHVGSLGREMHPLLLFGRSSFAIHAAMFSRTLVDAGARFDEQLELMEDLDFFIQCAQRTAFLFVDVPTCDWMAMIGNSGMGYGANANASLKIQAMQALRMKWHHQYLKWGAEPAGILAVAEEAARAKRWDVALHLAKKLDGTLSGSDEMRARVAKLRLAVALHSTDQASTC